MTLIQIPNFSVCEYSVDTGPYLDIYSTIPRQVLAVLLFILAVAQTSKEAFLVYRATKRWQPNRYMALIARDGIIYFFL